VVRRRRERRRNKLLITEGRTPTTRYLICNVSKVVANNEQHREDSFFSFPRFQIGLRTDLSLTKQQASLSLLLSLESQVKINSKNDHEKISFLRYLMKKIGTMSFNNNTVRSRWGNNNSSVPASRPPPARSDDEAALAALLSEASARTDEQQGGNKKNHHRQGQRQGNQQSSDSHNQYRRSGDKRVVEDDEKDERGSSSGKRRRRRWNDRDEREGGPDRWGTRSDADDAGDNANDTNEESAKNPIKIKANFGLSGALASDTQTGNARDGITLKFSEPPEARIPNTRWRLYVFRRKASDAKVGAESDKKGDDLLDVYHISRQSAYLFGRERKVADIPVDHGSLSKQHCVLQYRALPSKSSSIIGEPTKLHCKPYLMDLESTNGTFINGVRLDAARYYELRRGDVITLGASTREYVLLTEQSATTGL
jgi:smad nuclear-interacting protein 1